MPRSDLQELRRQVRVVSILRASERAGLCPLPSADLHLIAYFADALAPVWGLRIVDAQVLKRDDGPMSPSLQRDVDLLVGRRVVVAANVRHRRDAYKQWRLDADYALNPKYASRIVSSIHSIAAQQDQYVFVREVVFALSALGLSGMVAASSSDASYGDEAIAPRNMVDIAEFAGRPNATSRVALRFGELMRPTTELAPAEMIHLYVRELYSRLHDAA